jgi:hypothetical protein
MNLVCKTETYISISIHNFSNHDSSVSIVTTLWAGKPGDRDSIPDRIKRAFFCPKYSDQLWCPRSLLFNRGHELSSGVKRPGREAEHSTPYNAKVKNE